MVSIPSASSLYLLGARLKLAQTHAQTGTEDLTVPFVNAEEVIRQANATGIKNLLITIPGAKQ